MTAVPSPFAAVLSPATVVLPRGELARMAGLVRAADRLAAHPAYREALAGALPAVARFDPGHAAVMMGYDFHLTAAGPRLIEVNTNAGGFFPAWQAARGLVPLTGRPRQRLLATFGDEMAAYTGGRQAAPGRIAIIDENPPEQFLYPEMQLYAALFAEEGLAAVIAAPEELNATAAGVTLHGQPVELVYNRHCDFYLDSPGLAGLRAAYLAGTVCLTPNPHAYGLLADKRRLVAWRDQALLLACELTGKEREVLEECVPECRLLADGDREQLWRERAAWVFKPVDRFGSRGVLVGEKMTRGRFDQLDGATTLVQRLAPPPTVEVPGYGEMKYDLRLFAYRGRILGVTARLYRGQVTNLRTEGGGFARVTLG